MIRRLLIAIVIVVCLFYAGDYALLRYRMAKNRNAFGTVEIQPYYAVPEKGNKTEFMFLDPVSQTCIHSLLPHMGYSPCWYLSRKSDKRQNM